MLGEHVRNIRKKRGITLKELAEKTGLSIGYISQIERNLTDPSLSTLRKLSAALDIPTYLFMGGEHSTGLTTRQADMMILSQPNSNIRYHLLTPMPNGDFVPQSLVIRFELEPHCKDGDLPVIHPSEEILLLEQGQLDVLVESETIRLNAGDTTVVQSNLPHIVSNPGDTTAVGLAKPESSHRNTKKKYSYCLYFRLLKKVTGRWPFSRKWEENEMPVAIFIIHNLSVFVQR